VYQDIRHPVQSPAYGKACLIGNIVCLANRHIRVNLKVQINVVLKSRIASEQLFYSRGSGNHESDSSDLIDKSDPA
jgi:hypothetical protein